MADEIQEQAPAPSPDTESGEFDWGQFFDDAMHAEETPPPPVSAQAPPEQEENLEDDEPDDVELLKKQIAELTATVNKTAATTNEIEHKTRLATAMDAWRQQASPEELAMSDVLAESTSLEDLKTRSAMIKRVTGNVGEIRAQARREAALDMQKEFGYPIMIENSPIPQKEKVDQLLEQGDIEGAATQALKGVFNS